MSFYPSWYLFFTMNLVSTVIVLSSSNWFMIWIGLELSLLSFMPLFVPNRMSIEGMVKYLLIQAGGSSIFLLGMMSMKPSLVMMSMLIKLGLFPFHFWVPTVMVSFNWVGCILLSIFQKISPLIIIMKTNTSCIILYSGSASIFISNFLALNQTNTKALMAYSSISHTGWMVMANCISVNIILLYMLVYFFTSLNILNSFNISNNWTILQFEEMPKGSTLAMMNLMGMPPFSIFFMKLLILKFLTSFFLIFLVLMGVLFSSLMYLTFLIPSFMNMFYSGNVSKSVSISLIFLPFLMIL